MGTADSLWNQEDDRAEEALVQAAAQGDLEAGLLAIEDASPEAQQECRDKLDQWGQRVQEAQMAQDIHARTRAMVQVLGRDLGLRGQTRDYYDASNSHLSAVVERHRGLPILLSSVWILVGRRAGIEVDGVGMPGHFIARVGGPSGVLVDPFEAGRMLSLDACKDVVARLSDGELHWQEEFLEETPTLDLLERVLHNLIHSHQRSQDPTGLYRHARLLASLRQDKPQAQWIHARLSEDLGASRLALDLYEQLMERFPTSPQSALAAKRLGPLHSRLRMIN
jgi:regulator of sirC expression with transglutaminase-like and TPR domain